MDSRSRRKRTRETPEQPNQPPTLRAGCSLVLGLILIVLSLFVASLTGRASLFWLYQEDYTRTGFVVTELHVDVDNTILLGTANGKEVRSVRMPSEIFVRESPDGVVGSLMDPGKAIGMRIRSGSPRSPTGSSIASSLRRSSRHLQAEPWCWALRRSTCCYSPLASSSRSVGHGI